MKNWTILLISIWTQYVFSQTDSTLVAKEKKLAQLLTVLRSAKTDSSSAVLNEQFKTELREILSEKQSFSYPFPLLKSVGFVDSPDGQIRIVNWNIEQEDGTQKYCCFILRKDAKKQSILLAELIDNNSSPNEVKESILEANEWYGALYYKIIPINKGQKKLYTLLGWDGNNSLSTIKLIDVLYFSGNQPKLGNPLFKQQNLTHKRVVFEHSKKAVMSLKFEEQYKRIIYDHLSPETPDLKGFYSFYVPDFSYDAYYLEGSKWVLKEDVIGVNSANEEKISVFIKNEKTGKLEKKTIKNKWENPSDEKAPGGGSIHVPVTPENADTKAEESLPKNRKSSVKRNEDPGNLNQTLGTNRGKRKNRQ